jgi:hypothetical protein
VFGFGTDSTTFARFVDDIQFEAAVSRELLARGGRILMGTYDRRVDDVTFAILLFGESFEHTSPNALTRPAAESRVDALPRSKTLREVSPRSAGPQDPDHPFNHSPIRLRRARNATHFGRK